MDEDVAPPVVRRRVVRRVGILALNHPRSNALTPGVRRLLWDRVAGLEANPGVDAIVIMAEGRLFSSGLEVADHGAPVPDAPSLAALCGRIEQCSKPVIAAVQGPALGGGAELALAAHYRLATAQALFGLPDIALGLVPGAGGTQRLTRAIGADPALRMLTSGKAVTAQTARDLGLIDGIVQGDLASGAHALATALIERGAGPRRLSQDRTKIVDGMAVLEAVATARAALTTRSLLAARLVVDCIEAAALLPFEAALDFEAAAYEDCLGDPHSRALRHVFAAERAVSSGLLAPDGQGGRVPTQAGREVLAALLAAQDRALGWIVAQGTPEAAVDATYLAWGFGRAPFGTEGAAGPVPDVRLRIVAAMAAAGARLLAAGQVARAGDIDALAVLGLGFPRRSGGPMHAAQAEGLPRVLRAMREWAPQDAVWEPPPLMREAGRVAGGFAAVQPEGTVRPG